MRLLKTDGHMVLKEFVSHEVAPPYAILSHCWERQEIVFSDIERYHRDLAACNDTAWLTDRQGCRKIEGACRQAKKDGYDYVWIDTCCIDKSSSAELQEAINSMFNWYKRAKICYAYLFDVPPSAMDVKIRIENSKWFTRGWTLQELIAPQDVIFYDREWNAIMRKSDHKNSLLSEITGINRTVLRGAWALRRISVAARMSWASKRQTTRVEDRAYSLLGLFNVSIPLLYGEGERAFRRLQEEIIRTSDDESIFAWGNPDTDVNGSFGDNFLAHSPNAFHGCNDIVAVSASRPRLEAAYFVTNQGLRIQLPCFDDWAVTSKTYALLNCRKEREPFHQLALSLQQLGFRSQAYYRVKDGLCRIPYEQKHKYFNRNIVLSGVDRLLEYLDVMEYQAKYAVIWVRSLPGPAQAFNLTRFPKSSQQSGDWITDDPTTRTFHLDTPHDMCNKEDLITAIGSKTKKNQYFVFHFRYSHAKYHLPRLVVSSYVVKDITRIGSDSFRISEEKWKRYLDDRVLVRSYFNFVCLTKYERILEKAVFVVDIMTPSMLVLRSMKLVMHVFWKPINKFWSTNVVTHLRRAIRSKKEHTAVLLLFLLLNAVRLLLRALAWKEPYYIVFFCHLLMIPSMFSIWSIANLKFGDWFHSSVPWFGLSI